jgi:hypothetical protein
VISAQCAAMASHRADARIVRLFSAHETLEPILTARQKRSPDAANGWLRDNATIPLCMEAGVAGNAMILNRYSTRG